MSDWTKEQRAAMAADLLDIAARTLREGGDSFAWMLVGIAYDMRLESEDAESLYRYGRECFGALPDDIDAAVAAIARGEHPPDSLPGKLARYHGKAKREAEGVPGSYREHHCEGETKALGHVLDLLGCKVTP